MKKLLTFALILSLMAGPMVVFAKGGSSGGRSSGGSRSAPSSRPAPSKPSSPAVAPASKPVSAPAPKPPATKPSAAAPKVTAASAKTVDGKQYSKTGNVVGSGYQPRFKGGIVPPAGSVVYYPDNSWMMWIPLMYLMSNDSHRDAIVETPGANGAASTTQVVQEEGIDTMYVINWVITILLGLGLIALIVWLVNKFTKKTPAYV